MESKPKNPKKTHLCENCNFECSNKKDYNRHLMTAKHNGLTITKTPKTPKTHTTYNCDCGKTYKHLSSLCKHKKTCSLTSPKAELYSNSIVIPENQIEHPSIIDFIAQSKEIMDILVLQNKELTRQNKEQSEELTRQNKEQSEELKRQNKEHSDTIRELIPKIGSNNGNVVTATTNNQFNMQSFLTEDCKEAMNFSDFIEQIKISFTDLENQAETGYVKGITKLFIENLQGLGMNKRPIHCSDKKRKTLYIKENDEWDKEGSHDTLKKGIQEITRRTYQRLMKEKDDRPEEYSDMDSVFSQKCMDIQRNLTPETPRETSFDRVATNISYETTIAGTPNTIE